MKSKFFSILILLISMFVLSSNFVFAANSNSGKKTDNGIFRLGLGGKSIEFNIDGIEDAQIYGLHFDFESPLAKTKYGNLDLRFNMGYFFGNTDAENDSDIDVDDVTADTGICYVYRNNIIRISAGAIVEFDYVQLDKSHDDSISKFGWGGVISADIQITDKMLLGGQFKKTLFFDNDKLEGASTYMLNLGFSF